MNRINEVDFNKIFLSDRIFIDVRSEIEFAEGSLPGSINIPILNTQERVLVGTTYKKNGPDAAIKLGYEIVSGLKKEERLRKWEAAANQHPNAIFYCFRGGKRSQITQMWLKEIGIEVPIIEGGFKKARQYLISLIEELSHKSNFLLVSGVTGSAKTRLLRNLNSNVLVVDLERIANHRGSAFGYIDPPPTQVNFENVLAVELLRAEKQIEYGCRNLILIEDESRLIGPSIIPDVLFQKMRSSEIILIEETLEFRVNEIFQSYIVDGLQRLGAKVFDQHLASLDQIQKKLGGIRYQEIKQDILRSKNNYQEMQETESNKIWIEKLLVYYYDPIYLSSLTRRQVTKKFTGTFSECRYFLNSLF